MHRRVVLALGLLLCVPAIAQAASSIVVGNHVLAVNTPGQVINLNVTGNDQIGGLDLFFTINGGGVGPVVTAVDITSAGTIFAGNNTGIFVFAAPNNLPSTRPAVSTTSAVGILPILANGLLASVTFDTTGIPAGVYSWSLTNHPLGATDLGTDLQDEFIYPNVTNGTLTIVPEPSSVVMGLFAAAGIGAVAIRKRRARRA